MKHRIPRARRVLAALSALTLAGITVLAGSIPAQATPGETLDSIIDTDVEVGLTASASLVLPKGIKYTLTVTNHGPSNLRHGSILIRGLGRDFVLQADPNECGSARYVDENSDVIECGVTNVAGGSQRTITFEVDFPGLVVDLRLDAKASLEQMEDDAGEIAEGDYEPANNYATASCTVASPVAIIC